jgi:hypothetical protein
MTESNKLRNNSNPARKVRGAREGYFVHLPSIDRQTFLHLSVRGSSYRLRNFAAMRPHAPAKAAILPGYPEIDHLRASGLVSRWISVTPDDLGQSVITKPEYWRARVAEVNAKELGNRRVCNVGDSVLYHSLLGLAS